MVDLDINVLKSDVTSLAKQRESILKNSPNGYQALDALLEKHYHKLTKSYLKTCYNLAKALQNKEHYEDCVRYYYKVMELNAGYMNVSSLFFSVDTTSSVIEAPFFNLQAYQVEEAFLLGLQYLSGLNKDKVINPTWAFNCFSHAAERGHTPAQYNLGVCFSKGIGVAQDTKQAVEWFCKAAEQGDAWAQTNFGTLLWNTGVPRNIEEAAKWYRKAAEQGDASAQYSLGTCFSNGAGVPRNMEEAAKWYRKAAEQGHASAQCYLGACFSNGAGVPRNMEEAAKWYRKAAEQGDASAQYSLGVCFSKGTGVMQDTKQAVEWYRKAAEQGYTWAQSSLAEYYYAERNLERAFFYHRLSCKSSGKKEQYLARIRGVEVSFTNLRTIVVEEQSKAYYHYCMAFDLYGELPDESIKWVFEDDWLTTAKKIEVVNYLKNNNKITDYDEALLWELYLARSKELLAAGNASDAIYLLGQIPKTSMYYKSAASVLANYYLQKAKEYVNSEKPDKALNLLENVPEEAAEQYLEALVLIIEQLYNGHYSYLEDFILSQEPMRQLNEKAIVTYALKEVSEYYAKALKILPQCKNDEKQTVYQSLKSRLQILLPELKKLSVETFIDLDKKEATVWKTVAEQARACLNEHAEFTELFQLLAVINAEKSVEAEEEPPTKKSKFEHHGMFSATVPNGSKNQDKSSNCERHFI